jgi:hypothetical protein
MKKIFLITFLAFYFVISPFVHLHPGKVHYENGQSIFLSGNMDIFNFSEASSPTFNEPSISNKIISSAPEVKLIYSSNRIEKKKNFIQIDSNIPTVSSPTFISQINNSEISAYSKDTYNFNSSLSPPTLA